MRRKLFAQIYIEKITLAIWNLELADRIYVTPKWRLAGQVQQEDKRGKEIIVVTDAVLSDQPKGSNLIGKENRKKKLMAF